MGSLSFAQLKTFTAEESVLLERNLLPARVAQLDWIPGTERFAHVGQVDGEWRLASSVAIGMQGWNAPTRPPFADW